MPYTTCDPRNVVIPPFTGRQIAQEVGVSPATVSDVLRRLGPNRIAALEPAELVRRYQRERPGELIHIDIKKLGRFDRVNHHITEYRTGQSNGRGIGWEFVHVSVDVFRWFVGLEMDVAVWHATVFIVHGALDQ